MGQPELDLILKLPPLRSLNQRINVRHHLEPLNAAETELFIRHRLVVAGGQGVEAEFTRSASRLIYKASKGTPRVISTLCDYCLVIAFTEESHAITRKVAREAIRLHRSKEVVSAPRRMESRYKKRALIPALAGALALLVGLGLTGWNLYGSSGATSGKPSGKGGIVSASFLANPAPSVVVDSPDPIIGEAITEPAAAAAPTAQVAVAAPSPQPTAAGQSSAITSSFLMIEEDQPAAAIPAPPQPKSRKLFRFHQSCPPKSPARHWQHFQQPRRKNPRLPSQCSGKKAPEKKAAATGKVFSVQVASVKSKEKAESAARQFEPLGEVYIIPTTSGKTKGWYKILVGTFSSYQEALAVARQMNHVGMTKDALAVENHTPEAAADHPGADVNLVDAGSGLKTF
ncbi:SPOR domain-containing protein [bacterium]|nr:SPOR domain-containing protein [bacterium]